MEEHEVFVQERNKSQLNNQELSYYLYGKSKKELMEKIQNAIATDPVLKFDPATLGVSREELYNHYMKKTKRMYELFDMNSFEVLGSTSCMFPECLGLSLHSGMFITTLELLCDENQRQKYYERAIKNEILGCYAQTELGHGSDVQNLELQAIFDKQKQEFVFNSPTVSSTKWWIGDLGLNANHVVTQAQIMVDGKRKALGTFIVQIRSLEDHSVLQGVEVGDIGPKYGYNTKDNGFLRFNNYRVPKDSLLCKYMSIDENGKIQKKGNEKVSYGTMMKIRTLLLDQSYKYLGLSLTITTRYSLIRKQFKGEKKQERQIIEYQSQQNKIVPLLSLAYCQSQVYKKVSELVNQNIELNKKNDFSMLNSLHALISGLKAHFTTSSLEGLELLRSACGGHGYLHYSGLPQIMTEFSPTATYEGENTILLLQTARYLLKNYNRLNKNKELTPMTKYLQEYHNILEQKMEANDEQLMNVDNIEKILIFNSLFRISLVAKKFMIYVINKMDAKIVWDQKVGIKLVDAAIAHIHLMSYQMFKQSVNNIPQNSSSKQVMTDLLLMYGVERILENPSGIYQGGYLSSQQFQYLRVKAKEQLLEKVRPHLYRLVEGFNYRDETLRSAIGMKNGKPYENLFEWVTKHNPVNKPENQQRIIKEWMGKPMPIHKPRI